jgi:hypothetical protein
MPGFKGAGWYYWEMDALKSKWSKCHWIDSVDESGRSQMACGKTDTVTNVDLLPDTLGRIRCQVCERRLKKRTSTEG